MTEQDYELLSQYLDGELSASTVRALEQRLSQEPKLRANLQRLKAIDDSLKSAFNRPGLDRVPADVIQLLERPPARVVPLRPRRAASWGFALAASLVVAVSALLVPQWQRDSTPSGDALLAAVLEQTASRGAGWELLPDGRKVRPVLSFQSNSGQWCREFLLATGAAGSSNGWRGVACRDSRGWVNEIMVSEALAGSAMEYRPAGAISSDQVADYISANAAGIALSASQEAALIADHWQ